jgi:hypothetical protein
MRWPEDPGDEDRVTPRDGDIVEMQVGPKTATDVGDLGAERDQQRSTGSLHLDVAAWLERLIGLAAVAETLVNAGDGIETLGYLINSGASAASARIGDSQRVGHRDLRSW